MTGPVAEPMSSTPLLAVREVTKRYGDAKALDQVAINAWQGEFVALLGPSGCGKTTLLRCIAGFVQPDSGGIDIDGRDVTALPPYHRPLNTVFQGFALFPHMNVGDNVGYGPARKGVPRTAIEQAVGQALALVGLDGFERRQPSQLSGGQQQRVALARAIINQPRLLLLDEPLGALDLKLRKQMQIELKRLQTRLGITFLFVTHDQEEAMTMADRIVVMQNGRIEQVGTAREIYDRPSTRFVAEFIGEANLLTLESDGHAMLRSAIGGPRVAAPSGVAARRYLGVLRPESLSTQPADAPDTVAATVVRIVDGGGQTLVHLAVAGSELLMRNLGGPRPDLPIGSTVHVGWPADAVRLIEDAEAAP